MSLWKPRRAFYSPHFILIIIFELCTNIKTNIKASKIFKKNYDTTFLTLFELLTVINAHMSLNE